MAMINWLLSQTIFQQLGWTLIHSCWQGALIALLLAVLLRQRLAATQRYCAACLALFLMIALPIGTFRLLSNAAYTSVNANIEKSIMPDDAANNGNNSLKGIAGNTIEKTISPVLSGASTAGNNSPSRLTQFMPWLVLSWLIGIAFLSLRTINGLFLAHQLKSQQVTLITGQWSEIVAKLAGKLQISIPVRLYQSALVEVPTVIGWLKPVILLPLGIISSMPVEQLEALLAHELAHIRRHDYFINLFQTCAEILCFYHPAVWWISGQIRIEREHCCDDLAVAACGDRLVYARALTELEQLRRELPQLAMAATGPAKSGLLFHRIERLLVAATPNSVRFSPWLAGFIVIAMLSTTLVGARDLFGEREHLADLAARKQHRRVAVTFVSLPGGGVNDSLANIDRTMKKLIKGITANGVPAIGYVGERKLEKEGEEAARAELLNLWLDAGLELGNETYSHPYFFKMPIEQFQQDVIRGEKTIKPLLKQHNRALKYFSYPFLNTGPNLEQKTAFEKFLSEHGYTIAPVTIDNMDWLFAKVYREAKERGDHAVMQRVAAEYLPYMAEMMKFYEQLSTDVLGYELPQVLMLTASELNADYFDQIVEMLKQRGYQFISLDEALTDKAYQQPDNYTGPVGISWLQRWAITKGLGFRKEPSLPEYMKPYDNPRASASGFKS